jgi:hypothetical protein
LKGSKTRSHLTSIRKHSSRLIFWATQVLSDAPPNFSKSVILFHLNVYVPRRLRACCFIVLEPTIAFIKVSGGEGIHFHHPHCIQPLSSSLFRILNIPCIRLNLSTILERPLPLSLQKQIFLRRPHLLITRLRSMHTPAAHPRTSIRLRQICLVLCLDGFGAACFARRGVAREEVEDWETGADYADTDFCYSGG